MNPTPTLKEIIYIKVFWILKYGFFIFRYFAKYYSLFTNDYFLKEILIYEPSFVG